MKIVIGSDHGGYEYKEKLRTHLLSLGFDVIDVGTFSKESCNYAYFALEAAQKVSNKECDLGVLICNSGEGVSIAANKVKGVRCGIGYNDEVAHLIKEHNDCNMISFGAHFTSYEEVEKRVDIFINASFLGERHKVRVDTISEFENFNGINK